MAAHKECRICRYGGGICQSGFKKVHVRDDPHCRFHGVTGGNARPKQPHPPVPRLLQAEEEKTKTESRDEKTHYVTQGGLHLLAAARGRGK